jgi:hypothetical protein
MKKQNIIDLASYREELLGKTEEVIGQPSNTQPSPISDELKSAIETLIDRLRAAKTS